MFIAALDFTAVLPFAIFAAVAAMMWFLADTFLFKKTRTEERLDQMRANREAGAGEAARGGKNRFDQNAGQTRRIACQTLATQV